MLNCNKIVRQNGVIVNTEMKQSKEDFDVVMEKKLKKIITKLKELKMITNDPILDTFVDEIYTDLNSFKLNYAIARTIDYNGYLFDYRINPIKAKAHIHKATPNGYSSTRSYY